jgi:hypothetical protein
VAAVWGWLLADKNLSVAFPGLWLGGVLALLFWCREHLEIRRLGLLIREKIAEKAGAILEVPKAVDLVPSAVDATVDKVKDRTTRRYHRAFMWLAFFVTPMFLTLLRAVATVGSAIKAMRVQYAHTVFGFGSTCLYSRVLVATGDRD